MMGRPIRLGARDIQMETQYEYGTRAGVWRIARLLEAKNIKATVYAVGQAVLKAPDAAKYLARCGHEIASHGYRWIDYHPVPLAVEKEHIEKCISAIKTVSGKAPRGWYVGRPSLSSKGLVCHVFKEQGLELLYQCDSYADEMPYWTAHPIEAGKGLLTIPYTYDVNDNKFCTNPGFVNPKVRELKLLLTKLLLTDFNCFACSQDWLDYCKAAFDVMYQEGCDGEPKMMTIGLHSRIIGKPARFKAFRELLEYIQGHEGVWFATREEIARHWQAMHPFDKSKLNRIAHSI